MGCELNDSGFKSGREQAILSLLQKLQTGYGVRPVSYSVDTLTYKAAAA